MFFCSVRRYVHYVVTSNAFDTFIIVIICASSITLAAEDPVDSSSLRNTILSYVDYAFTALFTVEMVLKVNNAYFTPPTRTDTVLFLSCPCRRCEQNWRQDKIGLLKTWIYSTVMQNQRFNQPMNGGVLGKNGQSLMFSQQKRQYSCTLRPVRLEKCQ